MRILFFLITCLAAMPSYAQNATGYSVSETIYGRRDGMALTTFAITPAKPNGKAIVSLMSGGWYSGMDVYNIYLERALPFVKSGYTVFLTMHSSTPRYTIPDAFADVQHAIQFIRYNAKKFRIDPDHIGITGTSSGGHLSMLAATADDIRDSNSRDSIARVSSKVQAVAAFCPPTDFLNYGNLEADLASNKEFLRQQNVLASFNYTVWDSLSDSYKIFENPVEHRRIDSLMSPAQLVSTDDAPAFLMHGDADPVVPIQQSQWIIKRLQDKKVPAQLKVVPGAKHGWKGMNEEEKEFVAWFDKYLK